MILKTSFILLIFNITSYLLSAFDAGVKCVHEIRRANVRHP